jgi:hypothetical protein
LASHDGQVLSRVTLSISVAAVDHTLSERTYF